MNAFFFIAGVVVTILGIAAIALVLAVYIAVKYFDITLTFGTQNDKR